MTFVWAGMLAALLLVPLLIGIYAWSQRRRQPVAARYSSLTLIHAARPGSSRLRRHLPFALFVAAVASLALALARPAVVLSVPANGTTVILAVDVSGSMCLTDIEPTRLEVAQEAASDFVASQTTRTRIGIVAFSSFGGIVQSPTDEQDTVIEAIRSLTTGRRTAMGSGILASLDAIAEIHPDVARSVGEGRPGVEPEPVLPGEYAPAIIVVLTDGANNAGEDPIEAAQQAADRGVRVYTIGYGTEFGGEMNPYCRQRFIGREPGRGGFGGGFGGNGGSPRFRRSIDEDTLTAVADLTGGIYFPAESADELVEVFNELPTTHIMAHEAAEVSVGFVGISLLLGQAWRPLP
jgi:Ca-activated chloride channel family protein